MALIWEYAKALVWHWRNLVTGLLGVLLGVFLADRFPDLSAWAILGIISVVAFVAAQALAWRDMRSERDEALQQRDAALRAARPARIRVERFSPVLSDHSMLLRLKVFNDDADGTATLEGEVVDLEGCHPTGPELPWHVDWRHGGNQYGRPINSGTSEIIHFATASIISVEGARKRPIVQWQPNFEFIVVGAEGSAPSGHPAALDGVTALDQVCDREMVAVFRIWDQEHRAIAAEKRIALFYQEKDGLLVPDLRVDEI